MEYFNWDDMRFDDCWVHVFNHLPLTKRILFERVSRKWKALMPYTNIHSVHLADLGWPEHKMIECQYTMDEKTKTVHLVQECHLFQILKSILNRSGPYLHNLNFKIKNTFTPRGQEDSENSLEDLQNVAFEDLQNLGFGNLESGGFDSSKSSNKFRLNKDVMDLLVEKAPNLLSLNLNYCLLTLGCFPALTGLEKLEILDLGRVKIIEDDFSEVVQNHESIKASVSSTIENLSSLKRLSLENWMEIVLRVRNRNLTHLEMEGENVTAGDVRDLVQNCPNLEVLDMDMDPTSFDNPIFGALGGLHQLRKLSLYFAIVHSEDLAAICRGCPNLEDLQLSLVRQLNSVTDLQHLKHLKSLFIHPFEDTVHVTDDTLALVTKNGILEDLKLPCADLTDAGLKNLAQKCPNLMELDVEYIDSITDEGVMVILDKCKKLEYLVVTGTPIGDATMGAIGAKGINLRRVEAEAEIAVTENGIKKLYEERKKRLMKGEELLGLEIVIDLECPFSKEDMELVSLSMTSQEFNPE